MKGSQLFERERSLKPPPLPSNVILNLPTRKAPLTSRKDGDNSEINFRERERITSFGDTKGFDKENFNPSSSSSIENAQVVKSGNVLEGDTLDKVHENDMSPERTTPNTSSAKAAKASTDIGGHDQYQESTGGYKDREDTGKEAQSKDADISVPSSSSVNETQTVKKADFRTLDFFDSTVGNLPLVLADSNESNRKIDINETMKILIVGNAKCGKSSIIARYAMNSFHENYKTTIGADFVRKDLSLQLQDGEQIGVRLQLWDIAGIQISP